MQKNPRASSSRPEAGLAAAWPVALLVACEGAEQHYLRGRLSLRRVDCVGVDDAAAAVEYCAEHPVDLVVVDVDHLGEAALRLMHLLRRPHACRPAPKVALIGRLSRGRRWRLSLAKASGLAKPLDPRALDVWIVRSLGPALSGPEPRWLMEPAAVR
jgi:DNA-binding response OmpR family regulator